MLYKQPTCTNRSEARLGKAVPHGDNNAGHAKYQDQDVVGNLGPDAAVESVVEPGNKGSHSEDSNTTVVQSELVEQNNLDIYI